jgi:hypothetical protein
MMYGHATGCKYNAQIYLQGIRHAIYAEQPAKYFHIVMDFPESL